MAVSIIVEMLMVESALLPPSGDSNCRVGKSSPVDPKLHRCWAWQQFLEQLETVVVVGAT